MAINSIRLKNFKGFKDAQLELKPLTILLGPNSSGKSSFGQAIVALSKNLPRGRGYVPSLDFNDTELFRQPSSIDFGQYSNLVHEGCEGEGVIIELGLSRHGKLSFGFGGENALKPSTKIKELDLTCIEIKHPKSEIEVSVSPSPSESTTQIEVPEQVADVSYDVIETNLIKRKTQKNWSVETATNNDEYKLFFDGLKIEATFSLEGTSANLREILSEQLFEDAISLLSKVSYLRPDRAAPIRIDKNSPDSTGAEIDDWGNGSGWYLHEHANDFVSTFLFPPPTTEKKEAEQIIKKYGNLKERKLALKKALPEWLKRIGMAKSVETKLISEEYALQILVTPPEQNKARPLPDLGFGVSQVLPILLKGLSLKRNGLLIVEQPEAQLHPMPQAELADFFCAMIKCGRRAIVETHSEEFFHRLRIRAAMDSELAEKIAVYFFNESQEGCCSQPEKISLDEEAELKWPKGFLPDGMRTEMAILQMRLASKKKNK